MSPDDGNASSDVLKEKGDEILRRLLRTPPDPKTGKGEKPKKAADDAPSSE
jgi:hypothetical protein